MLFPVDDFRFLFHRKILIPCSYCAPFVPPNLLLYLANSLAATISEPDLYRLLTFQVPNLMSLFLVLRLYQSISPGLRLSVWIFHNKIHFYSEEFLASCPTPKLEYHPLSAVRDHLFNIFAAAVRIGGRSCIRSSRTRHSVVTGTHLSQI